MLYPIDNLGQWGILRDGLAHELPENAFSDGVNVRFREGYAEKFLGEIDAWGDSTIEPYHVAPLQVGDTRWWVECGLTAIHSVDNTGTHADITGSSGPYAATADTGWTSTNLAGVLVLNNGVDVPQAWAGTSVCVDLANWPADVTAKSVRAFRNALVAVNVTKSSTNYPYMLKWSSFADPGSVPASWDETDPTVEAGEADLSDANGELVDAWPLGQQLVVYAENSFHLITDVGGSFVFRADLVSREAGMLARNCVASFPGGHCVMGQGDVYVHSGGAPESILTSRARRWLFSNLDATNYGRSFVVANPLASEVWICFPEVGETACTKALVWNWKANTLGVRDLPDVKHGANGVVDASLATSWDNLEGSWDVQDFKWDQSSVTKSAQRTVLAASGKLVLADAGVGFSGSPMTARVVRTGLSFGAPDRVKLIRGVRPIFEGTSGVVNVRIGGAMEPNTAPTWSDAVPFTIGTDIKVDTFAAGRFIALEFESDTLVNWRIKQLTFDGELAGGY